MELVRNQQGVTMLEGLIFGGILVLLVFATGVALTAARERVRDYKRLADMTRVQAALELYFNDSNAYPVTDGAVVLGDAQSICLTSNGFGATCGSSGRVYLNPVPAQTPIGIRGSELDVYAYESNGEDYVISLVIERAIPQAEVEKGLVCARPGQPLQPARSGASICSL